METPALFLERQRRVSAQFLGPHQRHQGYVDRIIKKAVDIHHSPGALTLIADLILLAFDLAWRNGASPAQIISLIEHAGRAREKGVNVAMELMQEILNESGFDEKLYHPAARSSDQSSTNS